ncbi:hypothetical protein AQUCO_02400060v1 [Aquilegia coerulea]|uniref:Transposase-associated domain-containing protein n=1 Tax=Aquilegia coerulea TaxID=218851 RepID=A0A2G5DBY0_AQUCA|nr:hypothetical protein AQUCO_02400060v1 [Aquilegia coerulea]
MHETNRLSDVYLNGVNEFVDFAVAHNTENLTTCTCPCKKCGNGTRVKFTDLSTHLIRNGIDLIYTVWYFHGETSHRVVENENIEEDVIDDGGVGMADFVDVTYGVHEGVVDQTENPEEPYVLERGLPEKNNIYKQKSKEKLYPSCEGLNTTLSAIVELHNLKKQFGWSGASVTAALGMLKRWLPKGNTLPEKYPEMKAMLKDLGMKARCIHACVNNCILYFKKHENAEKCPQCTEERYDTKEGKAGKKQSKVPRKVLRHFPIIPRLKRLYSIPWIAEEMTWHDRAKPSQDYMRHPIDSA